MLENGDGPFDPTYLGYVTSTVDYITKNLTQYVLLDVHNYFQYRGEYIGTGNVTYQAFSNFWRNLAGLFVDNPLLIFGTMNEPNGISPESALRGANAAIAGIRASGARVGRSLLFLAKKPQQDTDLDDLIVTEQQLINVFGTDYSDVSSWTTGGNSEAFHPSNITDPENNWIFEMHQYFDPNYQGTGDCLPNFSVENVFAPATNWARANKAYVCSCRC